MNLRRREKRKKRTEDTVVELLVRKKRRAHEEEENKGKADEAETQKMRFELSRTKRKLKGKERDERKNNIIIKSMRL